MIRNTDIVLDAAAGTIIGTAIFMLFVAIAARSRQSTGPVVFGPWLWATIISGAPIGLFVAWRLIWSY